MSKKAGVILTHEELLKRRKTIAREDEDAPIIVMPEDDARTANLKRQNIHCFCNNWNLKAGQDALVAQQFWDRLYKEEKYREEWLEPPEEYGLCRHHPGRAVPAMAPAVIPYSDIDQSTYGTKKGMELVSCPDFDDRRRSGTKMMMGKYTKKDLER